MALAINIMDGQGLSNRLCYERLPKEDKGDTVLTRVHNTEQPKLT